MASDSNNSNIDMRSSTTPSQVSDLTAHSQISGLTAPSQVSDLTAHGQISGFHDIFVTSERLGSGAQGTVLKCRFREHDETAYAVKTINTNRLSESSERMVAMLEDELKVLNILNDEARILSPGIVQTFHAYESTHCTHIVMEHMKGGTLNQWRVQRESHSVTELETRMICKRLFEALHFCHQRNIAHRDIKLSNLLLARPNDLSSLKIGDFGFAKVVPPNGLRTRCGTPLFVAPEIVLLGSALYTKYQTECDIWSAGVVVYILLGGLPPFSFDPESHNNIDLLYRNVVYDVIDLDKLNWEMVSQDAKDMIRGMMTKHPVDRLSADKVLKCTWMTTSDTAKWRTSLMIRSRVIDEESCASLMPFEDDTYCSIKPRPSPSRNRLSTRSWLCCALGFMLAITVATVVVWVQALTVLPSPDGTTGPIDSRPIMSTNSQLNRATNRPTHTPSPQTFMYPKSQLKVHGVGGGPFDHLQSFGYLQSDESRIDKITQLRVYVTNVCATNNDCNLPKAAVLSLAVSYGMNDCSTIESRTQGAYTDGLYTPRATLNFPRGVYLTRMEFTSEYVTICDSTMHCTQIGPYNGTEPNMVFEMNNSAIKAFHGMSGSWVDAVGVYYEPYGQSTGHCN